MVITPRHPALLLSPIYHQKGVTAIGRERIRFLAENTSPDKKRGQNPSLMMIQTLQP
jgi:hypothetical protein